MANEKKSNAGAAQANTVTVAAQALLGANDKGRVTYEVNGETINLSFKIVRDYLTRGNAAVTDAEVIQFISLCKANKLNPFIGEAWLVKFQGSPASMITARDAFLKRAESAPTFEGLQSGIIIQRGKEVVEEEGAFFLPGDTLIGGWCRVYRSDRKFPYLSRVRLCEYNKGKSTWAAMPGTMIQKVAEAQALRKAFPFQTSGMYTPEEMPDDQGQQQPAAQTEANKGQAVFRAEEPAAALIDTPAPEVVADRPAPEFTPDPEPVEEAQPQPVPVQAQPQAQPAEERLPWENEQPQPEPIPEAGSQDANLDLFTV